MTHRFLAAILAASTAVAGPAWGHGGAQNNANKKTAQAAEETAFGKPGDPEKATRTVEVLMSDEMRFTPSRLSVKRGETVRFVVKNKGGVMHEMVLGTLPALKAHAEQMKKHPGMEHDAPNMAHVEPGQAETLVWQFSKAGEFHYACLLPGHFEAGMIGKVAVAPHRERTAALLVN